MKEVIQKAPNDKRRISSLAKEDILFEHALRKGEQSYAIHFH